MAKNSKKATAVAKNAKANKAAAKKTAVVKKAAAPKKATAKKAASKKATAKKQTVNTKAKKAAPPKKVALPKKAASKLSKKDKSSNTIKKQAPVKKTAKAGEKKAVPKKLATPKKNTVTKPATTATKTASKKDHTTTKKVAADKKNNVISKPVKHTTTEKATDKPAHDHKAELKKALAKVKAKSKEETKKSEKPFVMPKTNTEKARKYEPEFTKSVLDQSQAENSGPTMRYSDNELIEFRELITRKLETAKKELGYLQGLITRKDQMGGDESDNRYMTMEDGSLSMEREQLSQMASRQITFIDHLEKALMRIENKTYGICRVTGKLIDKARLRAVPHATLSIEAKMGIAR
jgi:RNA polymerase-binding transcription factor DksA